MAAKGKGAKAALSFNVDDLMSMKETNEQAAKLKKKKEDVTSQRRGSFFGYKAFTPTVQSANTSGHFQTSTDIERKNAERRAAKPAPKPKPLAASDAGGGGGAPPAAGPGGAAAGGGGAGAMLAAKRRETCLPVTTRLVVWSTDEVRATAMMFSAWRCGAARADRLAEHPEPSLRQTRDSRVDVGREMTTSGSPPATTEEE